MYLSKNAIFLLSVLVLLVWMPHLSYADSTDYGYESGKINQSSEVSLFQKTKGWWNKNKPGREKELRQLKLELEANEKLLVKVSEGMADIVNNAPYCPNSPDGKARVEFQNDPLGELHQRIANLKERIAELGD
jgi:hypothetical protein